MFGIECSEGSSTAYAGEPQRLNAKAGVFWIECSEGMQAWLCMWLQGAEMGLQETHVEGVESLSGRTHREKNVAGHL